MVGPRAEWTPLGAPATTHPSGVRTIESKELAREIAQIIVDKQGEDIEILDVSGPLVIADHFVIASARNARHARAIAGEVLRNMKRHGRFCRNNAGMDGEGSWVLLDFDDVVVHMFQAEARSFYDLEGLWADVPRLEFTPAEPRGGAAPDLGWEIQPDANGGADRVRS